MALYPSVLPGTQLCGFGSYLPYGSGGERLPSGTFWRTILITNIAGFIMMAINAALGSNYWYVNQPPPVNHPLVQGEWPFYLIGMEAAVVVLFFLFSLAFRSFKEVK